MYSDLIISFIYDLVSEGIKIWYSEEKLQLFVPKNKSLSEEQATFIRTNKPELIDALVINEVTSKHYDHLILKTYSQNIPLSFAQERLWFIQQYEQGTHAYHIPMLYRLKPDVDFNLLGKSINKVVERHEVLRSIIREDKEGNSIQSVLNGTEGQINVIQRKFLDKESLQKAIDEQICQVFDLSQEIPIRASIFECDGMRPLLSVVIHHIAFDGWSMEIFIQELESFYESFFNEIPIKISNPLLHYKDFAFWQRQYLKREQLDLQLQFWKSKLDGYETLNLPLDKVRPKKFDYSGADLFFTFDAALSQGLRKMAQDLQVSLYSLMLSAYFLVLRVFSNQDDLIVGTPIANRHYSSLKEIVGFFVNNIVLRAKVSSDRTIEEFIQSVGQEVIEAQLHQDLPFDKIVSEIEPYKDSSRHPLFQVMFTLQSFGKKHQNESILEAFHDSSHYQVSYFDITTFIDDGQQELQCHCNYATSLFNKETIERFITTYQEVLAQFVAYNGEKKKISDIRYLNKLDYKQVIVEWNQTQAYYPDDKTISQLFEEQAQKTPQATALIYDGIKLSYLELNEKSTQFAHYLKTHYPFPNETLIGICVNRSEMMLIALLGTIKAGYAYVPIDPKIPEQRIKYILNDTCSPLLIVDEPNADMMKALHHQVIVINSEEVLDIIAKKALSPLNINHNPRNLAYVMYTSGTTGNPKGVMIEHRGIVNLTYSLTRKYQLGASNEQEGILQFANFAFDVSLKQMMLALLNGFKLVLMPDQLWTDEQKFYHYLNCHHVTHLGATPSLLEQYAFHEFQNVKRIAVGGELLSLKFYDKATKHKILYNTYGVTEASVTSTFNLTSADNLTIGSPISNVTCYVLNRDLSPLPIGVIGELFIGGDGLARGYLNNPTLTAEKFIPNPFQTENEKKEGKNSRLYRTGDLVRWLNSGYIEYLGRNDTQVKIRGHRIELREIEQVIISYDNSLQCVVTIKGEEASSQFLVAYYVSQKELNQDSLKAFLHIQLPDYMIPRFLIPIEEIPLNINGKVDTKALPFSHAIESKTYVGPITRLERSVVAVWSEVLEISASEISVDNSFFELGGNSILAIKLISKIHRMDPDLSIPVAAIFTHRTIREFCHYLENGEDSHVSIQKAQILVEEDQVLSFAQERLWFYDHYAPETSVYNIPMLFKIAEKTDLVRLEKALIAIINRHEILRTVIRTSQNGTGYQAVYDLTDIPFKIQRNHFQNNEKLMAYFGDEAFHVFDLSCDYPLKISINEVMQHNYLCIIIHHIAFDGWSVDIFMKELNSFYNQNQNTLEALPIQYKDYALWQRKYLSGQRFERLAHFWKSKLEYFEQLNFPTDHPRPQKIDYQGANQSIFLDLVTSEKLRKVAQQLDLSIHNLLLSAYSIALGTYACQNEFVIGIPFANRHFKELENLIGFFVNSLPIKISYQLSEPLEKFFKKIEKEVTDAQIHQDLPLEAIIDILKAPKDISRHPIFQTMFTVLESHQANYGDESILLPIDEEFSFNVAKLDITLTVDLSQSRFQVLCNYAVALFSDATIQGFLKSFEEIVKQIALLADQEQKRDELKIQDLHFTNPFEQAISVKKTDDQLNQTIHKLFEEEVAKGPNKIAVKFLSSQIEYEALNAQANQMAHLLIQEYNIQPGTLVSFFLDRDIDLITAVLGVLKAGGVYVPISPAMPDERVSQILLDSRTCIIMTSIHYKERLESLLVTKCIHSNMIVIDDLDTQQRFSQLPQNNPEIDLSSSSLAYVIHTSGTTGIPKGVMIEHASIVNLKHELSNAYNLNETKRKEVILQSSNYSFDPFIEQFILSLLNGHLLLIMPDQLWLNQELFYEFLNNHQVTYISAPPSLLKQYDFRKVPSLKRLVFGGEALTSDCFDHHLIDQGTKVINVYGPTEAAIVTTFNFVKQNDLSIGVPIGNVTCYVLGENKKNLPNGAIGELYIGGIGVGRGYLHQQELTEEKFVLNPFQTTLEKKQQSNDRLYRTGDLVKRRNDGKLEYQGRIDSQVKIRGYRVELKDIEKALLSIEGVLQSVVILYKEDHGEHPYLVGYYVGAKTLDVKKMRDLLSQKLPGYMVPNALIQIDTIPLNNGKLNYRQLPPPLLTFSNDYRAPTNDIETQLCKIWAEVLKTDEKTISIGESFFNIGGNSIMSIPLINKINAYFKLKLSIADLFISESIELLAHKIVHTRSEYQPIHSFSETNSRPNLFMIHPGGCGCEVYVPLAKQLEFQYSCYGVDSYHLNHDDRMESLKALAAYYLKYIEGVMEETGQIHYSLLGWSFGGQLALEIAALLEEKGIKKITIFLLDYVHHDENIFNLRKNISQKQVEQIHGEHLISEGHDQGSIMRMHQALRKEEFLMQQPMSALLKNTNIVVFKAMQPGPTFGEETIKTYNDYVLSLPRNNIDLLVKDPSSIQLISLPEAHHLTILKKDVQILVKTICDQLC